jgi:hypothetical protein
MEDKINTSKISILFGDDIIDNEKSSLQFKFNLSSKAAEQQARHLNTLLKEIVNPMNSIVFLFPVSSQNREDLEKLLKTIFTGEAKTKMSKDISKAVAEGRIRYEIVSDTDHILVLVNDATSEKKILKEFRQFLAKGLSSITRTQENTASLTLKSLNSFSDIEYYFQQGESFGSALLRSFKAELKLDLDQELTSRGVEVLKSIEPKISSTPIGLLTFFKDLNMEFRFGPTDEFPENLRPLIFPNFLKNGMAAAKILPDPDKQFWNQFSNLVESGIEFFLTIEDLGTLHIVGNMPGYSKHFIRNIQPN